MALKSDDFQSLRNLSMAPSSSVPREEDDAIYIFQRSTTLSALLLLITGVYVDCQVALASFVHSRNSLGAKPLED